MASAMISFTASLVDPSAMLRACASNPVMSSDPVSDEEVVTVVEASSAGGAKLVASSTVALFAWVLLLDDLEASQFLQVLQDSAQ